MRAHDVVEAEAVAELLVQHPVLAHQVRPLHRPAQHEQQLVLLQGLGQVVEGALAHRVDGAVDGPVGGHQDDEGRGLQLEDLAQQLDAVEVGHLQVGEDDVEGAALGGLEGLAAVAGGGGLVALRLQDHLQDVALAALVVDDEDPALHEPRACAAIAGSAARGRTMRAVVPRPGELSRWMAPPWSETILRVRARPRPSPASFVE